MSGLDWIVVSVYLLAMVAVAAAVGRNQTSRRDYYLGGNGMSPTALATSTIATQCSTNSLLGAPAFVGFAVGGGMLWLQYELAVPLAMLALMFLLNPIRRAGHISVYAFLDERLGRRARLAASASFQIFRGIATGVTVYGVSLVLTLLLEISYLQAVLLLMGVTVLYDVLGGMRAVVISDVVQMVLIVAAVAAAIVMLGTEIDFATVVGSERTRALDFNWGMQAGDAYGFWPMLIGGFFLYCAYYGCDQSQAQRVLAARSPEEADRVLLLNGLLRFPLVFLYCCLGLALAAYAVSEPGFITGLPVNGAGEPNFNLVFPVYVLDRFPAGLLGLVMVGIFAAAMSSIDSSLNSLSAATIEDFVQRRKPLSERSLFVASKLATGGWGAFAVIFSFQVESIAPTVLEAINKISSMVNGPLLGLFTIALGLSRIGEARALVGFAAGIASNFLVWLWLPQISWLWWNVSGWAVTVFVAVSLCGFRVRPELVHRASGGAARRLLGMAALILGVCLALQML
jgi:SSS family solute:Na+ symporter